VIRTGEEYRQSLADGRAVWIDGEQVKDVATHPAFKPIVDVRARIYDLAHAPGTAAAMTYVDDDTGETCAIGGKPPMTKKDWRAKHAAVETVLDDVGGVVTRVGDETVGEMWSLYDGQDLLNEIDPSFSANIRNHVRRAALLDPFHVSANTDPKGDRGRLLDALHAGEVAGGEEGPVHSCGLLVVDKVTWPVTDLRVDWHDDPITELARLWAVWRPQEAAYLQRALDPTAAPSYEVPGEE
jgi:aromatic ring hydroxylase